MTSTTISPNHWTAEPGVASIRLTPRGRALLAAVLATALVCAAVAVLFGSGAGTTGLASDASLVEDAPSQGAALAARGLATTHVVVQGDTLWELATAVDPAADPRPMVDRIQQLNGLPSSDLVIGRQLWIPVPGSAEQ